MEPSQYVVLIAQAEQPRAPEQPSPFSPGFFVVMIIIIFGFYFLIQRPQRQAEAQRAQEREGMKKGDPVVSIGGIHGKVVRTNKNKGTVTVEVAKSSDGKSVEMEFNQSAVNAAPVKEEKNEKEEEDDKSPSNKKKK